MSITGFLYVNAIQIQDLHYTIHIKQTEVINMLKKHSILFLLIVFINPVVADSDSTQSHSSDIKKLLYQIEISKGNKNCEQAEQYFNKALDIHNRIPGETHDEILLSAREVAQCWGDTDNFQKELKYSLLRIELTEQFYFNNHHVLAAVYEELAFVYFFNRDYVKSIENYKVELEHQIIAYGRDYWGIGSTYSMIALSYGFLGNKSEAINWYMKELMLYKNQSNPHKLATKHVLEKLHQLLPDDLEIAESLEKLKHVTFENAQ